MNFLELKDIAERDIELVNPTSPEKILLAGKFAGLGPGKSVLDFGCGYGEPLALWAREYGISGTGIDIRENACRRAREKVKRLGLSERIQIVQGKGADYRFEPHSVHLAACIGASFIWGGFRQALQAMKEALLPEGKILIGEPYWLKSEVPPEFAQAQREVHTELQLWQIAREEGFDIEYIVRASLDDWDRYETANWFGLSRWIEENPTHPECQQVIECLHESQDEYFRYLRETLGWAIYLLNPVKYGKPA